MRGGVVGQMTWDGKPRRMDDSPESVEVRLALLEKFQTDSERWHTENKESLVSIHRRISDLQEDFAAALDKGIDAIMDKMESREKTFKDCASKVQTLENDVKWMNRWVGAAWASIIAGLGLVVRHGVKHP